MHVYGFCAVSTVQQLTDSYTALSVVVTGPASEYRGLSNVLASCDGREPTNS